MPSASPSNATSDYVGSTTLEALSLEAREYVERRWLSEVNWFAKATRRSRRSYFALSVTTLVSSAFTALLAGFAAGAQSDELRWIVAILGLISAVATGLLTLFQASPNWKRRSMTLEQLVSEGNQYFTHAGRYASIALGRTDLAVFVERIEGIVYAHKSEFFAKDPEVHSETKARPTHDGQALHPG